MRGEVSQVIIPSSRYNKPENALDVKEQNLAKNFKYEVESLIPYQVFAQSPTIAKT